MNQSLSRPLNQSVQESLVVSPKYVEVSEQKADGPTSKKQISQPNKKRINRKCLSLGCGIFFLLLGLFFMLALPALIENQIIKQASDQAILSKQNQDMWAHIPGETNTTITRNYTFFELQNQQEFILQGQKPRFVQRIGYKIQQFQDFFDITYNQQSSLVSYRDWLHFKDYFQSKSLENKVKILNVPGLGYWYTLKKSRPSVIFIQGFSLTVVNAQSKIIDSVIAQGISSQYLTDPQKSYLLVMEPAGISFERSFPLWNDEVFGFCQSDNLNYWIEATKSSFKDPRNYFSPSALQLKDYFLLTELEMFSILGSFLQFIESLQSLLIDNHYCYQVENCTPKQLTIRQIAQSYVTRNPPPSASVTPSQSICENNSTCFGYYPQISSFYTNVYLKQHSFSNSEQIVFDVEIVRKWLDYNPSGKQGEYTKEQSMLLHIGNLDALFTNGSLHDEKKLSFEAPTQYLKNIQQRFNLPSENHTRVFWQWIKYLHTSFLKQNTSDNQKLGMANLFSSTIYNSFINLKNKLQNLIAKQILKKSFASFKCSTFIGTSFSTNDQNKIQKICSLFNYNITSDQFLSTGIGVCKEKYGDDWKRLSVNGANIINLESFCDKRQQDGFGYFYHLAKIEIQDYYKCSYTNGEYCSDYELAFKQWINSSVTISQPPSIQNSFQKSLSASGWIPEIGPIQLRYFTNKTGKQISNKISYAKYYKKFNFDAFFNPTSCLRILISQDTDENFIDYMRYVVIFLGLKLTNERTVRQYIFGYNDEYLLERKNKYPPFGGDPSTPAYTAFNDLNLTIDQVQLKFQIYTGKSDVNLAGQYYRINNHSYITQNYSKFNGNQSFWVLQSPWGQLDYFYGTNGKKFAPNQHKSQNISIYVPNIQRYGTGVVHDQYDFERYGVKLEVSKLGEYMYLPMEVNPDNAKYYQHYYGLYNESSVLGFPFFMSKHHLVNSTLNWTNYIDVYDENGTQILPTKDDFFQQSFVIYEPYSGVAFQSALYMQANYFYEPDFLFRYPQTCLLPVFSINRSGNMTEQTVNKLFSELIIGIKAKSATFYSGIGITIIGAALLLLYMYMRMKENKNISADINSSLISANQSVKSTIIHKQAIEQSIKQ